MSKTNALPQRILISGASVAGPALAYWLQRYGFEVTVIEHAPALRKGGYGVDLRGAAITVAKRMGILEQIQAADTRMQGTYFVNATGRVEGQMSEAAMGNAQNVDIEIMRENLAQIIFNLTSSTVNYVWGDAITSIREHENGVDVQFEHASPATYNLVIGADGMHSGVRRLVFGDEAQFAHPLGCYISIFTLPNYRNINHRQFFYSLPGKTIGMYSAHGNSEAKGMFLFQSPPLKYDFHDIVAQKDLVTEAFAKEQGWETQRLLQYMQEAKDFYFDAVGQIQMTAWSKGRIALVGDAAYGPSPLSGQGSSMALVGAYVLAGELGAANGDHASAFKNYEQIMRNFVDQNQKIGKKVASSIIENSHFSIWLRNATMRIPGLMSTIFKLITKLVAKAANSVELKQYEATFVNDRQNK